MDSEHKWNTNNNILYRCKKIKISRTYTQHACKWKGTLEEYIQHIKSKHSASYFLFPSKPQKFQWKLPFIGDQTDLGIFEHEMGYFLYEIYYRENSGKLYFSLTKFNKQSDDYHPFYKLLFHSNNNVTEALYTCQANNEISDISKPIYEQKHAVILDKDVIINFLDRNRIFQWYIIIVVNQTITN